MRNCCNVTARDMLNSKKDNQIKARLSYTSVVTSGK